MKAKNFYLLSETIQDNAIAAVRACVPDGKTKVTLSSAGSKSARQRGLEHIWYRDVANSGVGGIEEESEQSVKVKAKRDFGMPIIYRDTTGKYEFLLRLFFLAKDCWDMPGFRTYFYTKHFHTEDFSTNEMAQYLTAFQVYYSSKGVNLSDPIDWKLLNR